MNWQSLRRGPPRTNVGRGLLLSLFIPLLIFAQVLGGSSALFHTHGSAGLHVHVLPEHAHDHDHHLDAAWHHDQHDGEAHASSPDWAFGEDVEGLLLELPELIVVALGSALGISKCTILHAALPISELYRFPYARSQPTSATVPRDKPQVRSCCSGVAALLRSSHALRI